MSWDEGETECEFFVKALGYRCNCRIFQVPFSHSLKLEDSCREADERREKALSKSSGRCWPIAGNGGGRLEASGATDPALQEQRVQTWWVPNADHNDVEHKTGVRPYSLMLKVSGLLPRARSSVLAAIFTRNRKKLY